jgi:hypothetical protein
MFGGVEGVGVVVWINGVGELPQKFEITWGSRHDLS